MDFLVLWYIFNIKQIKIYVEFMIKINTLTNRPLIHHPQILLTISGHFTLARRMTHFITFLLLSLSYALLPPFHHWIPLDFFVHFETYGQRRRRQCDKISSSLLFVDEAANFTLWQFLLTTKIHILHTLCVCVFSQYDKWTW